MEGILSWNRELELQCAGRAFSFNIVPIVQHRHVNLYGHDITLREKAEAERIKRDARVILCSGCSEQDATARFAGQGVAGFPQKPYRLDDLRAKLAAVLGDAG